MSNGKKDPGEKLFNCSDIERAAFEAGIKLGTIYHQFVGSPISRANVDVLEKAIEDGARVQPFVEDVRVTIDRTSLKEKTSEYDYQTLRGSMLNVWMKVAYRDAVIICEMRYIQELDYPLMYIKKVKKSQ